MREVLRGAFKRCAALRERTDAYRLVDAQSGELPGLTVEAYGDFAVLVPYEAALLKDAQGGKGTLGHLLKDDTTARRLDELLASLMTASDSLSLTSDYLRAHPNSVIWGRDDKGNPSPVDWRDRK